MSAKFPGGGAGSFLADSLSQETCIWKINSDPCVLLAYAFSSIFVCYGHNSVKWPCSYKVIVLEENGHARDVFLTN